MQSHASWFRQGNEWVANYLKEHCCLHVMDENLDLNMQEYSRFLARVQPNPDSGKVQFDCKDFEGVSKRWRSGCFIVRCAVSNFVGKSLDLCCAFANFRRRRHAVIRSFCQMQGLSSLAST